MNVAGTGKRGRVIRILNSDAAKGLDQAAWQIASLV